MDPAATLDAIFSTLEENDYEDCFYHCLDLQTWANNGGAMPFVVSAETMQGFLTIVKIRCKLH